MNDDRINENEMLEKLNLLLEKQNRFEEKITELSNELEKIKRSLPINPADTRKKLEAPKPVITESVNVVAFKPPKSNTVVPQTENNSNPQAEYRSFEVGKQAYRARSEERRV